MGDERGRVGGAGGGRVGIYLEGRQAEGAWCMLITLPFSLLLEMVDKGRADGPSWPAVTPEETDCYENGIPSHKEPVFRGPRSATCPTETLCVTLLHSVPLSGPGSVGPLCRLASFSSVPVLLHREDICIASILLMHF